MEQDLDGTATKWMESPRQGAVISGGALAVENALKAAFDTTTKEWKWYKDMHPQDEPGQVIWLTKTGDGILALDIRNPGALAKDDMEVAFQKLIDMGVEPYLVCSTLIGSMAQRLVRKICPKCKYQNLAESIYCNQCGEKL